jgi:phosphate transport system permease protein
MRKKQGFEKRRKEETAAFAVIKGLSFLTIAILALIIGFVLYKGLRYNSATRSTALPYAEASPEGLCVVVNKASEANKLEYQVLRGIYTDEYINWSKIDAEEADLVPLAVDPKAPVGERAAKLLFGNEVSPPWGGLVQTLPSEREVLAKVAATKGAVAIVSRAAADEALRGRADIKAVSLKRLGLAANSQAFALVDNKEVEDVSDERIALLLSGKIKNWKELGGPDLPIVLLAPPAGSSLESAQASAGYATKGTAAPDMAFYLASLGSTPGAIGLAFAEDVAAEADKAAASGESDDSKGIGLLMRKGVESGWNLTPSYLVDEPRLSGRVGGISTIILNTLYMLLLTLIMAAPLGVAAAVYLVEYAKQGPLVSILRLGTETLAGIPSIIFGLFGMLFFVNILHFGFGLLSGCLTLTLMILPTIERTSEEALKSVPKSLREGSLALGATKLKTIARVVIPAAAPGITTGLILGIGRAVGETAALLFTMGSDYKAAKGLFSSARVLSAHVYLLFAEGISFDRAFSTATVLIFVVLAFNLLAKLLVKRMNRNGGTE